MSLPFSTTQPYSIDGMRVELRAVSTAAGAGMTEVVDTIRRTITSPRSSVTVSTVWPTALIEAQMFAWHRNVQEDVDALKRVARYQHKCLNYQATYNAFLLGALTEEEFDEESNAFISEPQTMEVSELSSLLVRLRRLLDFPLSDVELGEYLEVDNSSLARAVASLENMSAEKLAEIGGGRPFNLPQIQG